MHTISLKIYKILEECLIEILNDKTQTTNALQASKKCPVPLNILGSQFLDKSTTS